MQFCVCIKLIMFKAKPVYDEKCGNSKVMKDSFINSWLVKFMSRNNLSLRGETTATQKAPSNLIGKFLRYVMRIRRLTMKQIYSPSCIIAHLLENATVNATAAKSLPLKSTGNKKVPESLFECKADRTKIKPLVVLHGVKREVAPINENF